MKCDYCNREIRGKNYKNRGNFCNCHCSYLKHLDNIDKLYGKIDKCYGFMKIIIILMVILLIIRIFT